MKNFRVGLLAFSLATSILSLGSPAPAAAQCGAGGVCGRPARDVARVVVRSTARVRGVVSNRPRLLGRILFGRLAARGL